MSGKEPEHVYADMNYRGHDYQGESQVHVDSGRRGSIAGSVWRWMKRRAAIDREYRTSQGRAADGEEPPKGTEGDRLNAVLSAAGMNFAKLLAVLGALWSELPVCVVALFASRPPGGALAAPAG